MIKGMIVAELLTLSLHNAFINTLSIIVPATIAHATRICDLIECEIELVPSISTMHRKTNLPFLKLE